MCQDVSKVVSVPDKRFNIILSLNYSNNEVKEKIRFLIYQRIILHLIKLIIPKHIKVKNNNAIK